MNRSIKPKISLFLLMLMSIGLTITTLHSHHHLDLNHPSDFADTGTCLNADTTLCPICGYLFQTDTPSTSYSGKVFFGVEEIIYDQNETRQSYFFSYYRGRSPPA